MSKKVKFSVEVPAGSIKRLSVWLAAVPLALLTIYQGIDAVAVGDERPNEVKAPAPGRFHGCE